jgi:phenylacetate-CoA ligase
MKLEELYLKLPIPLQKIAFNLEGWRVYQRNFGGRFFDLLREAESRTFWTIENIRAYRDRRLQAFIHHCYETVPFYRHKFSEIKLLPQDIQKLEDLKYLPILTKKEVQDNFKDLVSSIIPKNKLILIRTSGTTGSGMRFFTTKQSIQEQYAIWWRYYKWHGIPLGTWCAHFTGNRIVSPSQKRPPFWRYNYPCKRIHFSPFHMSKDNLIMYIKELQCFKPPWLHGYPSLLSLLASYILENGIDLGYKIRWVTIGAENLLQQQANLIQKAFGVKPRQHYGMAEAVANISECENGILHVDEDFSGVEFIPNSDGHGYKVIGTNFTNLATPLIRYDVQDVVDIDELSYCKCGRPGRIIRNIDGRMDDYIILKNGSKLGGVDHFFKDLINIREVQLYQKIPGEIIVKVVPGKHFSEKDEVAIFTEVYKRLGKEIRVQVEYVDSIPRSKNGKLRFILSEIDKGKLNNI